MSTRYNFTCDEELAQTLQFLSRCNHKSISSLAKELIEEALELREDLYFSKVAEEAEKASEGKPTYTHEEAWKLSDL